MRATLAFVCLVVAASCGKGGGGGTAEVKKPVGPAVDEKTAEKDARGLASELVETLGRGSKDSLFGLFDPNMFVFGPRRGDAYNRTDALVELGKIIDPKTKKGIAAKSSKLELAASLGGRSAWAFDTVTIKGEPYGVTAILVNTGDIWQVEAAVIAPMPSRSAIKSEAGKDAVVPVGATAKGKTDPGASGAVDRYRKGLVDNELFGGDLTGRAGALVIGPGAGEVARGKEDIKEMWTKRVDTKTRAIPSGDIISHVTPDGQLAWVSSPITQVTDKGEVLPMRAFAVFEKSSGEWRLIVLHESLAIDAAGAGTAFKKTLPPAPKEGAIVAKKDEPAKKDDKKVTKSKKDDDEDEKPKAKKDDKKVGKKAKDDDDEKPAKKDDKKKVTKKVDDDDEDETPKKKDPKQIAAEKKKAEEEKKAEAKKVLAEKKKAEEDKKADAKKALAEKKKAEEDKKAEAKKAALEKKKADDEKKVADKKKTAKKSKDDDDEDEKPKKTTKKDPKAKKEAEDPDKEYDRYPGQKKPKQTEEEQYEARKKARKRAVEEEKEERDKKREAEEKRVADEKAKKKEAEEKKIADEKAKKKKIEEDKAEKAEKAKKAKKKKDADDDEEEDEKPKKKEDAKKKDDPKKKKDDKKKKEPVEEEDEDRVIVD